MKVMRIRWTAAGLGAVALAMLTACEVTGVDGTVGVGYVGGYYEPYGYEYGGWGAGYRVGPGRGGDRREGGDHREDRGGDHREDRGGDRHQDGGGDQHRDGGGDQHRDGGGDRRRPDAPRASQAYRSAPASRPTPSIPNRPRGR
jgi:hypothetical protein